MTSSFILPGLSATRRLWKSEHLSGAGEAACSLMSRCVPVGAVKRFNRARRGEKYRRGGGPLRAPEAVCCVLLDLIPYTGEQIENLFLSL